MLKIGLTGGIGSGKTAATNYFQTLGVPVVDADVVAREVVEPGSSALARITEHFGPDILLPDQSLNRNRLRQIIFADNTEKLWLETLLHPLIRTELMRQLEYANAPYAILVSPLLFETRQDLLVDRTLLIDAPEEVQLARASQRDGNTEEDIRKIMTSQMPRADRLALADDVLCNDGDLASLQAHLATLHKTYLKLAHDSEHEESHPHR